METSPVIKIIEQPARCALRYFRYDHPRTDHVCHRFRYECEGRSAGSIPGASSTPENKTFPAIQVINYNGPYVVVVSCKFHCEEAHGDQSKHIISRSKVSQRINPFVLIPIIWLERKGAKKVFVRSSLKTQTWFVVLPVLESNV